MLNNRIIDGYGTGNSAKVTNDPDEINALVVATRPEKTLVNSIEFFSSDTYGSNMNINVESGGTPDKVHNGTDSTLWTASDIVGGGSTTFNSTDRNHTPLGALSVRVDNSPIGDVFQFAKGSNIDLNNYASLTMWINVDKNWEAGDVVTIYAWDTDTNLQVGSTIDLKTYFDYQDNDTWQQIKISLLDIGISDKTTVDALRFRISAKAARGPKFYIDDVQFEELGSPEEYTIRPNKGEWLYIDEFMLSIAAPFSGKLAEATVPLLPYDNLLGVAIPVGITYQREQGGSTLFSLSLRGLLDFMQLAGAEIVGTGSDGTVMWLSLRVKNINPLVLKSENADVLRFIVNDNLSGLLRLRISSGGKTEKRGIAK